MSGWNRPIADFLVEATIGSCHGVFMNRLTLIVAAIAIALAISWLSIEEWPLLRKGYSLSASLNGENGAASHVDFPLWRQCAHVLLWLAALVGVFTYIIGHRWAVRTAVSVLAGTLLIGMLDVNEYGTLGAPLSIWTILLLGLLAVLAKFKTFAV